MCRALNILIAIILKKMTNDEMVHFNKMAVIKGYAWWGSKTYSGQRRKAIRIQTAKEFVGCIEGGVILEIGCACGDYTKFLYQEFGNKNKIIAIDLSAEQIKLAKISDKIGNIEFLEGDCEKMDLDDNSVDCIISNSILHHVNLDNCLSECIRVLKQGGKIFLQNPIC